MLIYSNEDTLNSRSILERQEEIEGDLADLQEELDVLNDLEEAVSAYTTEWKDGVVLIHEKYMTEYCKELCKDIGDLPADLPWYIENNIDWDSVVESLLQDYAEVDFEGETYFVRCN